MPKKIILIRHGETDHNLTRKVQGWVDTPLNSTGVKQAKKMAKKLKDEIINVIYTSDLKRATQTAKYLSKHKKLKPLKSPKLREWDMGAWGNKTWDKISQDFSHVFDEIGNMKDFHWKGHKGESINQMVKRVSSFINHLPKKHKDETIAVVTHGGTKRAFLRTLKLVSDKVRHSFGNTAITILEKNKKGGYTITQFNDTSHLEEDK